MYHYILNFILFSFLLYIISKKILVGHGSPPGAPSMDSPLILRVKLKELDFLSCLLPWCSDKMLFSMKILVALTDLENLIMVNIALFKVPQKFCF